MGEYRIEASHEYKMIHDHSYRVQFEPDDPTDCCVTQQDLAEAKSAAILAQLERDGILTIDTTEPF